jgi:aspartyl-tRNA(Asn)/glutamyl-tRNA(Gln) amidotransferase subunit B
MLLEPHANANRLADSLGLLQLASNQQLEQWIAEALAAMPEKVVAYKKGKKGLIGLFVGDVKRRSGGQADPQKVTQLLQQQLDA